MPDLDALWARIERHKPIVLTGIPSSVAEAAENKRGDHVEVRCCLAREKSLHASPGDILIDDWDKHKKLWLKAGGIWITHTSAADTGRQLTELGL